jgi:DNA-binding MarR family transcriptional regulator
MSAIEGLQLLGLNDAARQLGVERATLTRLVRNGSLPGLRLADRWYVEARDLADFASSYKPRRRTRAAEKTSAAQAKIAATLADWQEATANELAVAVELHPGNVRKHLLLLQQAGKVQRDEEGLWSLTAAGWHSCAQHAPEGDGDMLAGHRRAEEGDALASQAS